MSKAVLISIQPKWCEKIANAERRGCNMLSLSVPVLQKR